ncbi:MAG: iron ABC transporter permease [Desulfobacterales bacterium]|nr:iron ABC transporter permease [Desulfobacterales bacterium]
MHFDTTSTPLAYMGYVRKKYLFLTFLSGLVAACFAAAVSLGVVRVDIIAAIQGWISGLDPDRSQLVILQIRLPQALAAIAAGIGLSCAGAVMQSVLRNPLASPFTLGISHAAAFGAACAVILFGSGVMASNSGEAVRISLPMVTILSAFSFSMATAGVIIFIARRRGGSPQVLVLTGVALGSLFSAGTMLLQFFADDIQLAAMVFWTFGDLARAGWTDVNIIWGVTLLVYAFFTTNTRAYNAMTMGDDTAQSLGINPSRTRLVSMTIACMVTAVIISFVGIIGFVGLVAPHIVRRVIGDDHFFLLPASAATGAVILLVSDTVARLVLLPHVLPVSILTAFLGAPVFIFLILKGGHGES